MNVDTARSSSSTYVLVYYIAQRTKTASIEDFAKELIDYLLEHHSQVSNVIVDVERKAWTNMNTSSNARHPTSFMQTSNELQLTTVRRARRTGFSVVSGLKGLTVMKTANSSFVKFYRDPLTTLREDADRLFGTAIQAQWTYDDSSSMMDFEKTRQQIRTLMIDMFAEHHSASVQHTLHAMAKYILENVRCVSKIDFTMPNIHCIPVDMTRFGEENKNEIFTPIDDPHGYIQCSVHRSSSKGSLPSKL